MYDGNPFPSDQTLRIDEDSRQAVTASREVRAIVLAPGSGATGRSLDDRSLQALLDAIPLPEQVRLFEVDYDSRLEVLPDLRRFEKLEYAHIAGRSVVDYSSIHAARSVKKLFLVNYKHSSLEALTSGPLDSLRLLRGRLESIAVSADFAFLQSCSRLKGLAGSTTRHLILDSCNVFDAASLPSVSGLSILQLLACKTLADLSWVRECRELKRLVITATPASRLTLPSLEGARLSELFLPVPAQKLREISRLLPEAAVSNGDVWYRHGELGEGADPLSKSS